jgi:hypothetical protein
MATATKVTTLKPIERSLVTFTIRGKGGPLVTHRWSDKAKRLMREKHAGKKTKEREIRDPEAETEEAAYKTADGKYGVDCRAIKCAILEAAHKDLGIEKTLVRKAISLVCKDSNFVIPFTADTKPYEMGEDMVRVGVGSADLRYRPYFSEWSVEVTFEVDTTLLQVPDLITLIDWAGSRVGIGEMRPEKGGDFGRFEPVVDSIREEVMKPKRVA